MKKNTAIWAEHPFQLYSVKEFLLLYPDFFDEELTLITKRKNENIISEDYTLSKCNLLFIDELNLRWYSYIKLGFEVLFVPGNFSSVYKYNNTLGNHILLKWVQKYSPLRKKRRNINLSFDSIIRFLRRINLIPNPLFERVFCFTKVHYSVLLGALARETIAVMESWDHPMKFPFLFTPKYALTWNESLKHDLYKFQGIDTIKQEVPLKFRYIDRFKHFSIQEIENQLFKSEYGDEVRRLLGKDIILYPTTTSSNGIEHEGEMKVIKYLCSIFVDMDSYLYIKPKPNGPEGDYDEFDANLKVLVGKYSSNFDSRDMLDDNYHLFRYYLIKKSIHSINVGTTFGLEIAYADKPVLQLNITQQFHQGFCRFVHTYHLKNYVLSLPGVIDYNGDNEVIKNELLKGDMTFSKALKKWTLKW